MLFFPWVEGCYVYMVARGDDYKGGKVTYKRTAKPRGERKWERLRTGVYLTYLGVTQWGGGSDVIWQLLTP